MKSKLIQLLGAAAAFLCLASMPTQATNIVSGGGGVCKSEVPTDPVATSFVGAYNSSSTKTFFVTCTIPRSPLVAGALNAYFYVDGVLSLGNGPLACSLVSTEFNGTVLGSTSFVVNYNDMFDQLMALPAGQVTTWAYTHLFCSLPPTGRILGVASLQ